MGIHYQSLQELSNFWHKSKLSVLKTILTEKMYEVASVSVTKERKLLLTKIINEKRVIG